VLYLKVIILGMGWVYKRPITHEAGTTEHSSSKQGPESKTGVWVG